jgi:hypothetical protein
LVWLNAYDVAFHDIVDSRLWRRSPLQENIAGVVAFRDDADYLAVVQHNQRANVLVGHHPNCVIYRVAGADRPYLMALIFQYMTNSRHDSTKGSIANIA